MDGLRSGGFALESLTLPRELVLGGLEQPPGLVLSLPGTSSQGVVNLFMWRNKLF